MSKNYSIKESSVLLGLSEVYIRRMIQKGKIETIKVNISENVWKHMISEETLSNWRTSTSVRSQREDGRNKFTLYANQGELAQIQKFLNESKLEVILERSNKPEDVKRRYLIQKSKKLKAKVA